MEVDGILDQNLLRPLRAVVTDVDGVMTDGRIVVSEPAETKVFHVRDGLAVKMALKSDLQVAILSGRRSPPVQQRANELGIEVVKTGRLDKRQAFQEILDALGRSAHEVAFVGDDIPDLAPLSMAGVAFCPLDAVQEVRALPGIHVVPLKGGEGVLRWIIEAVLKAQGRWDEWMQRFRGMAP